MVIVKNLFENVTENIRFGDPHKSEFLVRPQAENWQRSKTVGRAEVKYTHMRFVMILIFLNIIKQTNLSITSLPHHFLFISLLHIFDFVPS